MTQEAPTPADPVEPGEGSTTQPHVPPAGQPAAATAPTPTDPAPGTGEPGEPGGPRPVGDYAAAPPLRSAYPTAAEGGFRIDPVQPPDAGDPPGPGYAGDEKTSAPGPGETPTGVIGAPSRPDGAPGDAGAAQPFGADQERSGPEVPEQAAWMLMPILIGLVLGLAAIVGLGAWPPVVSAAIVVLIAAAAVLSWQAGAVVRRSVLIAAAGPAGVLIGYWVFTLFRG
ncbi:hypothetical protein ACO0LV_02110 [Pseudactinotalea sp. Z1739]|uniref:hypothetical protein n=1 Tax=Pseudactinotalea sp. Z1739 TaxID=3413028 RepID=UPI003C7DEF6F